jgi:hypothetical protein
MGSHVLGPCPRSGPAGQPTRRRPARRSWPFLSVEERKEALPRVLPRVTAANPVRPERSRRGPRAGPRSWLRLEPGRARARLSSRSARRSTRPTGGWRPRSAWAGRRLRLTPDVIASIARRLPRAAARISERLGYQLSKGARRGHCSATKGEIENAEGERAMSSYGNIRPEMPAGATTLPASYYTDPPSSRARWKPFHYSMWLWAGRTEQLPDPGSYFRPGLWERERHRAERTPGARSRPSTTSVGIAGRAFAKPRPAPSRGGSSAPTTPGRTTSRVRS